LSTGSSDSQKKRKEKKRKEKKRKEKKRKEKKRKTSFKKRRATAREREKPFEASRTGREE